MRIINQNSLKVGTYFIPELTCNKNLPSTVELPSALDPVELFGGATHNDVALLIASLLNFNDLNFDEIFFNALAIPHELALVGGLGFSRENCYIGPSCCSEFQDWRGMKSSLENQANYWMGHDPDPYFEFSGSDIVLWNAEIGTQPRFSIAFSINEFRIAETKIQKNLQDFTVIVKEWAQETINNQTELFIAGMENYLLNSHHYK